MIRSISQIAFPKSTFAFDFDGFEPELRFISAFAYVNVRWFVGYIRFIEKECVTVHAQDNRHGNSNG